MTKECLRIFLESVPSHILIDDLRSTLLAVESVRGVSDIHVWAISQELTAMTAHVWVKELSPEQTADLLHAIQHACYEKFGIAHTTIRYRY